MRFDNSRTLAPRKGETKIVKRFLLVPRSLGEGQTRWLETAYIKEKIQAWSNSLHEPLSYFWEEISFTTKEEYLEFKFDERKKT